MKNLELDVVFGGSSTKLSGHIGAASYLVDHPEITVRRVAGTSGGALTAALWATVGLKKAYEILLEMPYDKFFKYGFTSLMSFVIFGYATSGRAYYKALQGILGDRTFKDVELDIHIVVSNMSLGKAEVWSRATTPDIKLRDAVYISTCIPGVFKPISLNDHLYRDGSIYWDFPINIWRDWPRPRIGFKFLGDWIPNSSDKWDGLKELRLTIDRAVDANGDQAMQEVLGQEKAFIVPMDTHGLNALDFALSNDAKKTLYDKGSDSAAKTVSQILRLAEVNDWWTT